MKDLDLIDMEEELESPESAIKQKRYDLIFDATGLQSFEVRIRNRNCDKSPIGKCAYDIIEDSACDFCIFCNQPDERK